VQSHAGAVCYLHRDGGGRSGGPITIQANGHSGNVSRGGSWPASSGAGYTITAVCTWSGQTVPSAPITVPWP
jgi:hypothetical protein